MKTATPRPEVTNDRPKVPASAAESEGPPPPPRLVFGPFALDPESGRLMEDERVVPLAPRPFETLRYLASHPGRVVPKAELMEKLWPGTFVTDDVLVQCVVEIRRALGDHAKTPQYVQTIPRRGYEFLPAVRLVEAPRGKLVRSEALPPSAPTIGLRGAQGPSRWPPAVLSAARRAVAMAGILGVVALAWAAWRSSDRLGGPPAAPAEPGSLVVMPLLVDESAAQSGWLRHGLAEMIRSQLGQTPGVHVVARHRLASALAEAGSDEDQALPPDGAMRLARRLRAQRLVTGSFLRVEDRFVVEAQVIDVATGRTEGAASVNGRMPGELLAAVDELCLSLFGTLASSVPPQGGNAPRPTRLATQSIEAYRLYVEAVTWFARGGRRGAEEAEKRLDQATTLDPSFAQAHLKKAEVLQWRREWGYGDPDPAPAVRAAARLAKDLPERGRLLVESFEALIVRDQPEAALKNWRALLQLYPTYAQEIGIPGLMATTLHHRGRWDDVILVGEAYVDSPSVSDAERARLSSQVAHAFRRRGEFERALDYARRAVRLWPVREGPRFLIQRTVLGRMALEADRREEALAEFHAVRDATDADVTNLTDAAWGLYMSGETSEAAALVDRALGADDSYGNAHHLRGWLRLAAGDHAGAAASLEAAFEHTPRAFGSPHHGNVNGDLAALYYAGVAYQKLGQKERAATTFRRLMAHCRRLLAHGTPGHGASEWQAANFLARAAARLGQPAPDPGRLRGDDTTYFVQSARLHAVQGRREQALRELSQGLALGHGEHRHIFDDPDFESLKGDLPFPAPVTASVR
jgi:DNA-binding winged helix-turn-helix (wHTH) protein/tetratricopeptide (TPR) repeat protein/TolB-like protein